ncbi:uncharacterized protein LOC141620258 [Silene latifolia]|uniref:uncharacterized protein LOC141620258 n=1 Tax=Silene latifolia TaxID=37657 RepID=UPI003D784113
MKVVTKCIANRLKGVMDDLVSPFQSAFVPNRSIADNIVIAQEILHTINHRSYGKKGMMALKADMSKAYDRLNCNFIKGVLSYLNLPGSRVQLIMSTIESVSYEILLNGAPMEKVEPAVGLGKDDNLIKGIKICKNGPEISHLLFADDSLFFIRGDYGDLDFLKNIIDEYCVASGQFLNKDKSSLLFSPNWSFMTVKKCLTEFTFAPKHDLGNYLGLPTSIGSSKRDLFKFLVDKTKRRLSSWNNILLSSAGKLTLIRSVLSSLSLFSLSNPWKAPQASSWALKSLVWGSDLIYNNIVWTIGCSSRLNARKSKWIKGYSLHDLCGDFIDAPTEFLATVKSGYYVAAMALSNGPTSNVDRSRMNEMVFKNHRPWPLSALNYILGGIQCMNEVVCSKDASLLRAPLLDSSPVFGLAKRIRNSFPYWIIGGPGFENVCTIKCDAAWKADKSSGMGWCLLDGNGTLRNTARARSFGSSALHAEGHAAIMALKWALDEGYLLVRLVTDCLILVMQVAGAENAIAPVKCIIYDLNSIASHFQSCSLSFCPRRMNKIAHNLAPEAIL